MSMEERDPIQSGTAHQHEATDAHPPSIIRFAIGLAIVILISLYAMARLVAYYAGHQRQVGPKPSPLVKTRQVPPFPQLQVSPGADMIQFRAAEDAKLNGYGWVDRQTGIVRIPVDRAMDLLAERGLPTRGLKEDQPVGKGKK
jgi:hypothetical protein